MEINQSISHKSSSYSTQSRETIKPTDLSDTFASLLQEKSTIIEESNKNDSSEKVNTSSIQETNKDNLKVNDFSYILKMLLAGYFQKMIEVEEVNQEFMKGELDVNERNIKQNNISQGEGIKKDSQTGKLEMPSIEKYMDNILSFNNSKSSSVNIKV